ncbi:hypothetical protein DSO57_1019629 [Entomophthora muscae]|uniref:Uncharacterized protein n=1 Tax=Entomophthora muscae TaxID=34485 RepID=A0ACC2SSS2_9FUNG|nr:hypothetical protein DSO57_1019629 [Entomophthora muscae]
MYKFIEEQYRQIVQNDSTEVNDTLPLSSSSNSSEFLINSKDTDSRINQLLSSIERTATAMAEMDSARLPRRSNFSLNTPSGHDLNKSFYSQRDANRSHPNFTYPNDGDASSNESSPKHSCTPSLKYSPESVPEQEDHPVSIPESNPQHKLKTRLAPSLSSLNLNLNIPSAHRTTHSPLTPNHSAKDYPIDLTGLAKSLKATTPSKPPTNRQPPPASSTRIAYHAHTKPNNCHRPLPQLPDALFNTSI